LEDNAKLVTSGTFTSSTISSTEADKLLTLLGFDTKTQLGLTGGSRQHHNTHKDKDFFITGLLMVSKRTILQALVCSLPAKI
jgi:hypothetical protein